MKCSLKPDYSQSVRKALLICLLCIILTIKITILMYLIFNIVFVYLFELKYVDIDKIIALSLAITAMLLIAVFQNK